MTSKSLKRKLDAIESRSGRIKPVVYIYRSGEKIPNDTGALVFLPSNGRETTMVLQ